MELKSAKSTSWAVCHARDEHVRIAVDSCQLDVDFLRGWINYSKVIEFIMMDFNEILHGFSLNKFFVDSVVQSGFNHS